jgi:predicted ATPase/DNA-binding SARP family transcriptional activator
VSGEVHIDILGPLEVRAGPGHPVEVAGPRLRRLLLRLALDPGRVVISGQLVDAVWDEHPPAGAANALQALVSRLRRLLPDVLESHPSGYRLAVPAEAVDAARFEALALAGREQLGRDPGRARALLGEALALWRGPALADAAGAGFAEPAVARLDDLRLQALEDRVEADLAAGASDRLVAELEELVAAHPLSERLGGQLLRALALGGRQADALGAYERLRARLAEELGIDPSPELQAVHVAVLRGQLAPPPRADPDAGAPPPPAAARTNLRAPITSFVGRGDDLDRIGAAFSGARLVTLTGPGGAGKTRLAAEAAASLLEPMPDGVWMVELGSVVDPVDLPQAVLSLFGARELRLLAAPGMTAVPPLERLVEAIGDRRLLLVVDNCEHLVAAAAALVDHLLARCPGLSVLATSREPLGIAGEVLHPVGPLAVPEGEVSPAEALAYPAVRLLADRGAAARPGFGVDETTLGPVLGICRALDGLPLAIELAAARFHALSPGQVAARLDDRFRLLADGRPVVGRHQTLRAVIDWSWELLGRAEQVVLRRLSVFAGGATLEAIERVCAGPDPGGPAADEVLYLLAGLVDKSLVVAAEADGVGVRYGMLETVRAYGAERLAEAGEDETLARAHAGYFLHLAEQAEPELRRPDQLRWLARLAAERDNLHAALRWATDRGEAAVALRLAAALGWYWFLTSARAESLDWMVKALALPGEAGSAARAQVLAYRSLTTISGGIELDAALELGAQALALVDALPPDEPGRSHPVLVILPALMAMFGTDDDQVALDRLAGNQDHPDPWMAAMAHLLTGALMVNFGEAAAGEREPGSDPARFRELGERWGVGQALVAQADLSSVRGQPEQAMAALAEAREVLAGLGDREDVSQILIRTAGERARAGQIDQAEHDLEAADRIAHEVGAEDQKLFVRLTRADLARWQGRLDEARKLLEAAIVDYRRGGFPVEQVHAVALAALGHLEVAAGRLTDARDRYRRALEVALATHDRPVIARVVGLAAAIALAHGDPGRAAELLGTADVLRGMPDEADVDLRQVREATRAALGDQGFALATGRGAARPREEVLAALAAGAGAAAEVSSAAGRPAGPAARTPPR